MEEALLGLDGLQIRLGAWMLAALVAAVHFGVSRQPWKALGVGLMSVPMWRLLLDILPELGQRIQAVAAGGVVHAPISPRQLSDGVVNSLWFHLGYLTLGFLAWALGHDGTLARRPTMMGLARALRATGIPLGRGEGRSVAWGLAGFPLLVAANLALLEATRDLSNSDASQLWSRMTWYHVVLMALAAGVGEELLYRGFMQTSIARLLGTRGPVTLRGLLRGQAPGMVVALLVQALVFGLAHSGYANLQHLLFATSFGLMAGLVALGWGLWAAIVLHVLVDVYAFGLNIEGAGAWLGPFLLALTVFAVAFFVHAWRTRASAGHRSPEEGGASRPP